MQYRNVRQGTGGSDVRLREYTYVQNPSSTSDSPYFVDEVSDYPIAGNTSTKYTTSHDYTFHSGTNAIATREMTFPTVTSAQNGSNSSTSMTETFDVYGNRTQITDQAGIVNTYEYDPVLGAVTEEVLNYDTGSSGPGYNVTSDYESGGRSARKCRNSKYLRSRRFWRCSGIRSEPTRCLAFVLPVAPSCGTICRDSKYRVARRTAPVSVTAPPVVHAASIREVSR